ncbi:hypothetical protein CC1G_08886 [Coprinopsis cinerea okayama7|uniref:DUF6533 domain-containing protein n=1 Tax=Coprinopsis cinerea (strain Okayama-7 / 130 / ATCC MYA-4618 / FGSC 9003) TaxID=240176 RepID=A8P863_COPC7|nr:hypothetical protein CC1G_08886 [Coprinopsis cinerea okayama7\|eukprot:XP_001839507.2 hypothetical protein CC1G_08886 [Coprinopsis cinerea okayama7\
MTDVASTYEFGIKVASLFYVKTCIDIAGITVFLYDYVQTFYDEVTMIWTARLSLGKVLFLVVRYTPFVDLTLFLSMNIDSLVPRPSTCVAMLAIAELCTVLGIACSEAILISCICALLGARKIYSTILWIFVALCVVVATVFSILFLSAVQGIAAPWPLTRCYFRYSPPSRALFLGRLYYILLAAESVAAIIAVSVGVKKYWRHGTKITTILYRDGTIYYIALLTCTILNIITNLPIGVGPLNLFQRSMHAILANRLLLDTRRQFQRYYTEEDLRTGPVSEMEFGSAGEQMEMNAKAKAMDSQSTGEENFRNRETRSGSSGPTSTLRPIGVNDDDGGISVVDRSDSGRI